MTTSYLLEIKLLTNIPQGLNSLKPLYLLCHLTVLAPNFQFFFISNTLDITAIFAKIDNQSLERVAMGKWRNLSFIVLLSYYLLICVLCAHKKLENDECRYLSYAKNLTQGYYTDSDTMRLWNGPGYPLFVSFFVLLKLPLVIAKYCNAFFLFAAVLFFYQTLRLYCSDRTAFGWSFLLGLYPPFIPELPRLLTEPISIFLMTGFLYFFLKSFRQKQRKAILLAILFGAYLMLTKVMYGYVITAGLFISLVISFWKRDFRHSAMIYAGCLLLCLPYLFYTYSLTGRLFYWSNAGGTALHCMSRPHANEWGDWFNNTEIFNNERLSKHRPFFETLKGKNYVEQDDTFKREAIKNICHHPTDYALNWFCNLGRMWFNYPFAYKYQRPHTLFYTFPNALLITGLILSMIILTRSRSHLPVEILSLILLSTVFLFGSSLVYCLARYLVTIVPILLFLIVYSGTVLIRIQWQHPKVN